MHNNNNKVPIQITDFAVRKIKFFVDNAENSVNLKLRVYIIGGGCGGFQYGFTLDGIVNNGDCVFTYNGITLVIDPMSLQYLFGAMIDYHEGLEGSKFVVINPNARTTCSCGSSFSV